MTPKSSLVPGDFLMEGGRVNRPPLRAWVTSLLGRLPHGRPRPDGWLHVSGCLNNASLVEVYRGRPDTAKTLCELQLHCAQNLIQFQGAKSFAMFIAQPWINLGRLQRLQGQHAAALESFSLFHDALTGTAPVRWPFRISREAWRNAVVEESSSLPFVLGVYVVDSTKTFLSAGRTAEALKFLQRVRALPHAASSLLLDEAELLVRFKQGQFDEATALMEGPSWNREGGYGKLVRVTYRVALLAASGGTETARQLAVQLKDRVLNPTALPPQDHRVLRYLHYLGGVLLGLGLPQEAGQVWRKGLAATEQLEDVPLRLALLESLLALNEPGEADALVSTRSAVLADCMYVSLLAARGLPLVPSEDAEPLFAQLHGRLAEVVGSSALPELESLAAQRLTG